MKELLEQLKKPFPVENLHWRLGQVNKAKTKAMMLVYIDARDVMDRLDEVCGANWTDEYKEVAGRLVCTITINGVSKSDGAGDTDFEAEKGGLSDAFKRAAVKWGVGRYLYDASKYNTWVPYTEDGKYTLYKDNKDQLDEVAKKLSGINVKAEKAKATRAETAQNIEYLREQADKCIDYLNKARFPLKAEDMQRVELLLKQLQGSKLRDKAEIIAGILMDKDTIGV